MYLLKNTNTGYMFDILDDDTLEKVGSSEVYTKMSGAATGIATAITSAVVAEVSDPRNKGYKRVKFPRFEQFQGADGKWRARLKSKNGKIIASGLMTNGKYIEGYIPHKRPIIIVVVINGVPIIVVVENPFPDIIGPKAEKTIEFKKYLENSIKGAAGLAGRFTTPTVLVMPTPDGFVREGNIGIKSKPFDIKELNADAIIKRVLKD